MKHYLIAGLFVFSGVMASTVLAQDMKIGVVNFQEVVQKSTDYEALKNKLEKQFTPEQKKLIDGHKELQKDVEELRRNDSVLKDADKKKLQEKIIKKQQELQTLEMELRTKFATEQEKGFQEVANKVRDRVASVAKKENINIIFTKDAVLYSNAPDITQKVIDTK